MLLKFKEKKLTAYSNGVGSHLLFKTSELKTFIDAF